MSIQRPWRNIQDLCENYIALMEILRVPSNDKMIDRMISLQLELIQFIVT